MPISLTFLPGNFAPGSIVRRCNEDQDAFSQPSILIRCILIHCILIRCILLRCIRIRCIPIHCIFIKEDATRIQWGSWCRGSRSRGPNSSTCVLVNPPVYIFLEKGLFQTLTKSPLRQSGPSAWETSEILWRTSWKSFSTRTTSSSPCSTTWTNYSSVKDLKKKTFSATTTESPSSHFDESF